MATTDDARAVARRLVRETLAEAGLAEPDTGPPPPLTGAQKIARRLVRETLAERAATAGEPGEEPPAALPPAAAGGEGSEDVAEGEGSEVAAGGEASGGAVGTVRDASDHGSPPPTPTAALPLTDAQRQARRIVADVLEAEEARRAAAAAEPATDRSSAVDEASSADAVDADQPPTIDGGDDPAAEAAASDQDTAPGEDGAWPAPQIDLLPPPPTSPVGVATPAEADPAPQTAFGETAWDLADLPPPGTPMAVAEDEAFPRDLPAVEGPASWRERWRARRRLKRELAQWPEDAPPAPRRTGRWLFVLILILVAIAILFPMAVSALRDLVAL